LLLTTIFLVIIIVAVFVMAQARENGKKALAIYAPQETVLYTEFKLSDENLEKYLLPKLEKIKKISYDEKFDVIAHSMGGFITIDYLTGDDYQSDIDKVVLQGTPLMGASKVYPAWEGGLIPEGWETMKVYLSILFIGKPVIGN